MRRLVHVDRHPQTRAPDPGTLVNYRSERHRGEQAVTEEHNVNGHRAVPGPINQGRRHAWPYPRLTPRSNQDGQLARVAGPGGDQTRGARPIVSSHCGAESRDRTVVPGVHHAAAGEVLKTALEDPGRHFQIRVHLLLESCVEATLEHEGERD